MAIIYQKPPEEGRQIAYEKVKRVLQAFPNAYKGLKIEELKIADPDQMYSIGLGQFALSKLLSSARLVGWRYIVMHDAVAVAEVPLTISPKDGKLSRRVGVFGNKLAQATVEALRKAEGLAQVKKENYECRYLVCYSISFYAIWLHGKSDDIIMPLPPTYKRMNAYQPYSESQIVQFLRSDAENALKYGGGVKLQTSSDK
jgi:hypothetical protein